MRYQNRQGWEGNSEDEAFERGRGYYGQGYSGQRESGFGYGRQQGFQGGQGGGYGTGGMSGWSGPEGSFQEGESWGGTGSQTHSGIRQSRRGRFTGRGPQGYKRTDERIEEDVNEALTMDGDLDAVNIEVKVQAGVVTLTGTVESRQAKRDAEDLAEDVFGVKDVENRIRVQPTSMQNREAGTQGTRGFSEPGSQGTAQPTGKETETRGRNAARV
jgi:osmotically-inducible protein OsmY